MRRLPLLIIEQEQPPEMFYEKSCSLKFRKFYRKAPVLESLLNKIAGLKACNFIKNRVQHMFFLLKFAKFLRNSISKKICVRLPLIDDSRMLNVLKIQAAYLFHDGGHCHPYHHFHIIGTSVLKDLMLILRRKLRTEKRSKLY